MTTPTMEAYGQVSALMDRLEDMTDWEYDFVMNVANYEEAGNLFSADQMAKITELHQRYCE